ncbi:PQQ-binding-like beta-propeller repeat protein [Cellulomonas sp. URHD0024]|uniref:outer membrane protein assembly factor BamB family protein n=1 Tax=Cellulomonas sp. URHD0024 TaxID=1302620 RepID=UPI00041B5071|nr:PQQ-binding-like beta-propeller repeat protein [Cellulomonas sp. URHD0024]
MSPTDGLRTSGHRQVLAMDEAGPPEVADVTAAPRDWIRRRAAWLVVAAVLAVIALVGAQTMVDARERDRLAYLADVPGVLQPLPGHVVPLWHFTPAESVALVADDTAGRWTIGTRARTGYVELRGTDPDTGALRWSTPFPFDDALLPEARGTFPSVLVRCASASGPPDAVAVCGADVSGPELLSVGTPLMALDPTDGTVLAHQILPAGSLWAVSDGHLVIAEPVADDETHRHWDVRATDPQTGAPAWQDHTPTLKGAGPLQVGVDTTDTAATLTSDPARVLLHDDGHAWVWSPDGASRRSLSVGTGGSLELGRSGTLVWAPFQSSTLPAGVLVTRRGKHVPVDGPQVVPAVDDGSAAGVVLLRTATGVAADDARTGEELWRADGRAGEVLVLDGAVIAAGPSSVVSRDARTGDERWRVRLDATPVYLGADPLHVVVLTDDLRLRSLDLGDGRADATSDLRSMLHADVGSLADAQEHGGRLVVTFQDGSGVALG